MGKDLLDIQYIPVELRVGLQEVLGQHVVRKQAEIQATVHPHLSHKIYSTGVLIFSIPFPFSPLSLINFLFFSPSFLIFFKPVL